MFRRKTDQVYATLQQVQRRITEQSGAQQSLIGEAKPPALVASKSPALYPFNQSEAANGAAVQVSAASFPLEPQVSPSLLPGPSGSAAAPRRFVLQLSAELAGTLLVLWLLTFALGYFVGARGARGAGERGVGYAPGAAGNREPSTAGKATPAAAKVPAPASRPGNYVLVLQSVPRASPQAEQSYQDEATRFNKIAEQNAERGYKPWFAVRATSNGGLQLVFGCINGQFGVDKEQFASLFEELEQVGHKGLFWVQVNDAK